MRILVLANIPPYVIGGAEIQVSRMVEKWADFGHEVEIAGHRIFSEDTTLGKHPVRLHRLFVIEDAGRLGRALSYFLAVARLVIKRRRDFDILYCRGLGDAALSIAMLKWVRLVKLPLVVCPTGAGFVGTAAFLRSMPGWRVLVRMLDRYCDALVSITPAISEELKALGFGRPQLCGIPNGIVIGAPVVRKCAPVERLVWVGRLNVEKGVDVLIKALSVLKEEGLQFRCGIVGEGPERHALTMACAALALDDVVVFCGERSPSEIRPLLAESDLFVLPSRSEGMANAALEAMEAGLPIVLTRCGGIDTYVDESIGWVCEPGDPLSLANALRQALCADPESIIARGKKARELVEERFDIDVVSAQNLQLFEQVVRDRTA